MSSHILTYSGVVIDPLRPSISKIKIYDIAHHLSNICRFGGAPKKFYSVAQHSVLCCALLPLRSSPIHHLAALLHDAAEAYLGDIITPLKYHPAFAAFREYERILQDAIESRLILEEGISVDQLDEVREAVKEADLKACALEAKALMPESKYCDVMGMLPPDTTIPEDLVLKPWPAAVAKHQFLDHYFATVGELKPVRG